MNKSDKDFYDRADEHIFLANDQVSKGIDPGMVSASYMFGLARFNAWLSARGFANAEDFRKDKHKMKEYFMAEYSKMLDQNLEDYIVNFNSHMGIEEKK